MCGLFGFVGQREIAQGIDLDAARGALAHRGPDDSGTYRGNSKRDPGIACALAHTRLAILDLSAAGHQPMASPDGRYTIVYNGEVYNFPEIRRELEALGISFVSNSDTEVVLQAYVRWGNTCISRFRGMFAFAIWDEREGSALLVRDRLGIKPLYYTVSAQGIAFASEIRTLLKTGRAERTLSLDGLFSYLSFGSVSEPHTIVQGVKSLAPAHLLEYREGQARIERYWSIPEVAGRSILFEEAVEELRPVLRQAVKYRLLSDVPLGVFLSGGIDSSAVVGHAASESAGPIHTFTVTFDEKEFSEERYAAEVAARFGCEHHQVHVPAATAAGEIENALHALDQPSADGLNTYVVSHAARQAGLSVALSGLGGDELFAGYEGFRTFGVRRRAGSLGRYLPAALIRRGLKATAAAGISNRARKLAALIAARGEPAATYATVRGMFMPAQIQRLISPELQEPYREYRERELDVAMAENAAAGDGDDVNLFSRFELTSYVRDTLLRDTDAMSMAHALEVRVPLLDHRVVELVAALPSRVKLRSEANKALLLAASPTIPRSASHRAKMGFVLPLDRWFRGPVAPRLTANLRSKALDGVLRSEAVEELWSDFSAGEKFVSHSRIWSLAALGGWCAENRFSLGSPAARSAPRRVSAAAASTPRKSNRNVLLCLPGAFDSLGGIEMYNRLVIRAFQELAQENGSICEVLILNDAAGSADARYSPEGATPARSFGRSHRRFVTAALSRAAALQPGLIVFGHVNFAQLLPGLVAVSPGARTWFLTHGIEVWRQLPFLSRTILKRASRILAVSDFTRRELARFNAVDQSNIGLLPNALDPFWRAEFAELAGKPERDPQPPVILTVARLFASEKYKGIDSVIRALPNVALKIPAIRYVVLGDGDDRPRLEALAQELGVAAHVVFRGRQSAQELAYAYSECSIFVMPSSKEGFGIVYLEAAFFGKPSIAGDHGGAQEFIEQGVSGYLVDREDIVEIEKRILDLLTNKERRQALGREARKRLESDFTYNSFRRKLMAEVAGKGEIEASAVPMLATESVRH
ncbi:MAG: asparagine synthase (glutamine-hydrolyzing) [Thermoanaerobaculia bacterium]